MQAPFRRTMWHGTMPPVASQDDFAAVLERLVGEHAGGIRSWRALAKRMLELDPQRRNVDARQGIEDWKATINRYRRREANPREERIKLFAAALGVERDVFPEVVSARRQREEASRRFSALEERIAELERVIQCR